MKNLPRKKDECKVLRINTTIECGCVCVCDQVLKRDRKRSRKSREISTQVSTIIWKVKLWPLNKMVPLRRYNETTAGNEDKEREKK